MGGIKEAISRLLRSCPDGRVLLTTLTRNHFPQQQETPQRISQKTASLVATRGPAQRQTLESNSLGSWVLTRQIFPFHLCLHFRSETYLRCTHLFPLQRSVDLRGEICCFPSPVCLAAPHPDLSLILLLVPVNGWKFFTIKIHYPTDEIKDHT